MPVALHRQNGENTFWKVLTERSMMAHHNYSDSELRAVIEDLISEGLKPTVNEFVAEVGGDRTPRSQFLKQYLLDREQVVTRRFPALPQQMQESLDLLALCLARGAARIRADEQERADVLQQDLERKHAATLATARLQAEEEAAEHAQTGLALDEAEQKLREAEVALAEATCRNNSLTRDLVAANESIRRLTEAVARRDTELAEEKEVARLERRERARLAGALHECRGGTAIGKKT